MEGWVLAASPSFLQTTCEGAHSVSGRLAPNLPVGLTYLPPYHPAKEPHVLRATEPGERAEATGRKEWCSDLAFAHCQSHV